MLHGDPEVRKESSIHKETGRMTTVPAMVTTAFIRVQEALLHPMDEPVIVVTKEIIIIKEHGHEILQMPIPVDTRKQAGHTMILKITHEQEHQYRLLPITHVAPGQVIRQVIPGEVFSGIQME